MKSGTIAATLLAVLAVVGISWQPGLKGSESSREDRGSIRSAKPPIRTKSAKQSTTRMRDKSEAGCSGLQLELEDFLDVDELVLAPHCYIQPGDRKNGPSVARKIAHLKLIIALLPDPVHTHLSGLFDQFAVAIQEGGQDEKYDFDSSWIPWDDQESSYSHLLDEKIANEEKEFKENEPGVILFRRTPCSGSLKPPEGCGEDLSQGYSDGLVVFVVGEEATDGIHRKQFRNAVEWTTALQPDLDSRRKSVAILGPSFSGSIPSLAQLLSEPEIAAQLDLEQSRNNQSLAVYSGSVSSLPAVMSLQDKFGSRIVFHSFVQNDQEILDRFFHYMCAEQKPGFGRVAMISEDETAYGRLDPSKKACPAEILGLYYPRDISALRDAYQTKSLFGTGASSPASDMQRRNLPSDLADPSGRVHDSIPSYGANQTPLAQEAMLTEIVAELRDHRSEYILLRGTNTLDQLFLANFLRRNYPDGRIIILGSDLMFIRERGATGLNGVMTLSTYPLFPLEHEWTEHQNLPAAGRVFSSDTAEGTYVAFRLLLNNKSLNAGNRDGCQILDRDEHRPFLPSVSCANDPPIPDYSLPFWMLADHCREMTTSKALELCPYQGPPTWLAVVGVNRFWPTASLIGKTATPDAVEDGTTEIAQRRNGPAAKLEIPPSMKVFLIFLVGLSVFHLSCCWFGSYTAKPAFRAHFASQGEWSHRFLVFGGSCCLVIMAVVAGLGAGVFHTPNVGLSHPWFAFWCVTFVTLSAGAAVVANGYIVRISTGSCSSLATMSNKGFVLWTSKVFTLFIAAAGLICILIAWPLERALTPETRVLTYWRAMHLLSGVSPVVPVFSIAAGLFLLFWFALHQLALFGPDRPCLPPQKYLRLRDSKGDDKDYFRMFSHEDAATRIEQAALPLDWKTLAGVAFLAALFVAVGDILAGEVPVRSLGARNYSIVFLVALDISCALAIVLAWRLYRIWQELKRLLTFLDRLVLRRTLAALQGFSWGSVWKMSGNVLEIRYKVISRQMECMNHTISALEESLRSPSESQNAEGSKAALHGLLSMRDTGAKFADWYSSSYMDPRAGNLESFRNFQVSIAETSGILMTQLLVPAWRKEEESLVAKPPIDEKEGFSDKPTPARNLPIRNAEELVCLTYLGFVQNVLGSLRITALTVVALFLACTFAVSTYPFDPRQALTTVLVALFVILGVVIVKVYAEMHRDSTLSVVTNTKPGELGAEFWFKIIGFGFAPMLGLLVRLFPGITDFVFSWLQPSISSLK